jgi:hypothetical protein
MRTLVVVLALAACSQRAMHSSTVDDRVPLPDEWVTCTTTADCVAIEMGCCDHCNGGWVLGVNTAHAARATSAYHARCDSSEHANPDGTMSFCGPSCTEVGCGGIRGACIARKCTWSWDAEMDGNYVPQLDVIPMHRITAAPSCP